MTSLIKLGINKIHFVTTMRARSLGTLQLLTVARANGYSVQRLG